MLEVRRCVRCVMDDSSDDTIKFDSEGNCNYCTKALSEIGKVYLPDDRGKSILFSESGMINKIKKYGKRRKYDCVMGLSGGLDSSYLAYLGHKWGLRVLAIHIDDGYDTEISKKNLSKLVKSTGFDYEIIRPDPIQFNNLTLAFMKARVPNIAVPQDNILLAYIIKRMEENRINWFLSGGNFALESILQKGNTHSSLDLTHIIEIHRLFGTESIDKLEFISSIRTEVYKRFLGIKSLRPLNFVDYNRDRAFEELRSFCGFEYYGRKHLENKLTAFAQLYWFPRKFGVDKRTSHLSSMIVSGQMTRDEAMKELSEPICDESEMNEYISEIIYNMGISRSEFESIMASPPHKHEDYKTEDDTIVYCAARGLYHMVKNIGHGHE